MGHDGVALAAVVVEGLILCWLSWAVATTRGRGGLLFGLVLAGAVWGISVGFARVTAPVPDDELAARVLSWAVYGAASSVLLALTWMTAGRYRLHRRRAADAAIADRVHRPALAPVPLTTPSTTATNGAVHRRRRRATRRAARAGAG